MTTSSLEIAILVGCDQCGRRVCDIAELPGGQLHPVPLDAGSAEMYGEPWFIEVGTNPPQGPGVEWWVSVRNAARGLVIYDTLMASEGEKHPAELAQWERVVAAINACVGVSTEELTKIADWKGSIANHEGSAAANLLVALGWKVFEPDGSEWT